MKSAKTLSFAFVSFLLWVANAHASITYTDWNVSVGFVGGSGSAFTQIPSPFVNSHSATNGIASASAQYNIVYDSLSADIQTTTQLSLQGGTNPSDFCFASVKFFTNQPIVATVDSSFSYVLPSGTRFADFSISVSQRNPSMPFFSRSFSASPTFGDPASGTWLASTNGVLLPANANYELRYSMSLQSSSGSPTQLSQGSGMAHFTLQTVPEPSTAALLSAGVLLRCRRHKRR